MRDRKVRSMQTPIAAITAFVLDEFLPDVGPGGLDPDYDLVAGGVIDSLGLLKVLAWLEATYDFPTDEVDVGPDDLATVAAIGRLLTAARPRLAAADAP